MAVPRSLYERVADRLTDESVGLKKEELMTALRTRFANEAQLSEFICEVGGRSALVIYYAGGDILDAVRLLER